MTREEYMMKLKEKLEQFNLSVQEEILEDYEQHFAEGLAQGRSEGEIIEELGNIEDMIQEFSEEDYKKEVAQLGAADDGSQSEAGDVRIGAENEEDGAFGGADAVSESSDAVYGGTYREIVLDCLMADTQIKEAKDGKLHVYYENEDRILQQLYYFYQYEENGIFYAGVRKKEGAELSVPRRVKIFGKNVTYFSSRKQEGNIYISIEIPKNFVPKMKIKTVSGDICAEGIEMERLELSTANGDIYLKKVKADKVKAQTASGDIEVTGVDIIAFKAGTGSGNVFGKLEKGYALSVSTGSGDVEMKVGAAVKEISLGTGSGDVELDMSAVEGAEVKASVGSGSVAVCGSDFKLSGGHGVHHSYGDGSCKVKVGTGSGDVSVKCK